MTQRLKTIFRSALTFALTTAAAVTVAGCADRIPTLSDQDEFPEELIPSTIEYILDASDFLSSIGVYSAGTVATDFPGLVVAHDLDGVLFSNVLARFAPFPDTITVNGQQDFAFEYTDSRVVATVPDSLQASEGELTFYLWTIVQPWDTATVSWENAVDQPGNRVPWRQPGGTRGVLLDAVRWVRADTTVASDTLLFSVPAAVVKQLANDEIHGLMVTLEVESARGDIGPLVFQASIRPSVAPDTTVIRTVGPGRQLFVFTPPPVRNDEVLRVGGFTSDRSVLRINVPGTLPRCTLGSFCGAISAGDVVLNRVDLLLDPVYVENGFRPISPFPMFVRRVLDVELGERAPLGASLARRSDGRDAPTVTISPDDFANPAAPISLGLTGLVVESLANDSTEFSIALLAEPEASRFDYAWFGRNPRLRFVYTLPRSPELP